MGPRGPGSGGGAVPEEGAGGYKDRREAGLARDSGPAGDPGPAEPRYSASRVGTRTAGGGIPRPPPLARARPTRGRAPLAASSLGLPLTHRGRPWWDRGHQEPGRRPALCPSRGRSSPPSNFSVASLGPDRYAPPPRAPAPAVRPAPARGRPREQAGPAP